jgi:hypothetical protein
MLLIKASVSTARNPPWNDVTVRLEGGNTRSAGSASIALMIFVERRIEMVGPCLCGDPYCPSCGDPAAAAFADAIDLLLEDIGEAIQTDRDLLQIRALFQLWKALAKDIPEFEKQQREDF